jgi:hypothetical protein
MILNFYETSAQSESNYTVFTFQSWAQGGLICVASASRVGFQEHNCRIHLSTDLHLTVKLHANICGVHRLRLVSVYDYPAVK